MELYDTEDRPEFRDEPFLPAVVALWDTSDEMFAELRERDVFLHHPYESFGPVVQLLQQDAHLALHRIQCPIRAVFPAPPRAATAIMRTCGSALHRSSAASVAYRPAKCSSSVALWAKWVGTDVTASERVDSASTRVGGVDGTLLSDASRVVSVAASRCRPCSMLGAA